MSGFDEMLAPERIAEVVCADCLEHMRTMPGGCVDALITDPPYGLGFMGVAWDTFGDGRKGGARAGATFDQVGGNHHPTCAADQARTRGIENRRFQERMTPAFAEALRVCKPGAHLLCFGGTRTYHRMACAVEDAGWEVRDCIMWVYGSGMPHGQNVSKMIDKKLGAKRESVPNPKARQQTSAMGTSAYGDFKGAERIQPLPATRLASEWDGWNTQLKPAWEPIIVARKPLDGTVVENIIKHETGAINVDACRVPNDDAPVLRDGPSTGKRYASKGSTNFANTAGKWRGGDPEGRYPANLVHDGSQEVLDLFPDSKGQQGAVRGTEPSRTGEHGIYGAYGGARTPSEPRGDSGSAARFFYCAKASRKERGEGNDHPTVKPLALMEWLVKLVTREDALVLDPFAGSGSTLVAAQSLGRDFIGIERDPRYCEIALGRLGAGGSDD